MDILIMYGQVIVIFQKVFSINGNLDYFCLSLQYMRLNHTNGMSNFLY